MAAFTSSSSSSFQQQLPSYYSSSSPPPTTINKMCVGPFEEPTSSQFFQFGHRMNLDQTSTKVVSDLRVIINNELGCPNNFLGVTANKNSTNTTVDSSSIVTADNNINYSGNALQHYFTQTKDALMDKKRKSNEGSSSNSAQSKDMRAMNKENKKQKKKVKHGELENKKKSKKELKTADGAANGYIHVRARRGQATDSHSLAERVRREKISERMKLLQALVPGCEKVTGKALMLDEIINYVQSLQNQVEFLSMKLASINPVLYDFGMDLESFMARPDQDLNSLPSTLQGMQQLSPTLLTANHYPVLMDHTANSLLLHHAHISSALPQDHRQVLWEVDEQRYNNKIMNYQQSGVSNSGLFPFN